MSMPLRSIIGELGVAESVAWLLPSKERPSYGSLSSCLGSENRCSANSLLMENYLKPKSLMGTTADIGSVLGRLVIFPRRRKSVMPSPAVRRVARSRPTAATGGRPLSGGRISRMATCVQVPRRFLPVLCGAGAAMGLVVALAAFWRLSWMLFFAIAVGATPRCRSILRRSRVNVTAEVPATIGDL